MIRTRKSGERGHANHGWLESYHTFSFANYHDPNFTGFHDLLVINEDYIKAGQGFGTHGHKDMEIVTYVLAGALEHKDSMGTGSVLRPGRVQRMSAGTGVSHSEFNHSKKESLHLLQIWILPRKKGLPPSYEEREFSAHEKQNRLQLIVSPEGDQGSLRINQDASIYAARLDEGKAITHLLKPGRHSWLQVSQGTLELNGKTLNAGDGAAVEDEFELKLVAKKTSEVLIFDLP